MKSLAWKRPLALILVFFVIGLCSCRDDELEESLFSHNSDVYKYGNYVSAQLPKGCFDASRTVPLDITIGTASIWFDGEGLSDESYTYTKIEVLKGVGPSASLYWESIEHYDDFHRDEKFLNSTSLYEVFGRYPNRAFSKKIELILPEGECVGIVSFYLVDFIVLDPLPDNAENPTEPQVLRVGFCYAKNDEYVVFSAMSSQRAKELLAELTD